MVVVKFTEKEVENLIHLLEWDNELWVSAGYDATCYVRMNDRCLKKLQEVLK